MGRDVSVELLHEVVTSRDLHGDHGLGEQKACKNVEATLRLLAKETGVDFIIVGHTPGNTVRQTCDSKFLAADSSLSRYFRAFGNRYCPIGIPANKVPGSGCDRPINEHCEGQAVRMKLLGGKWSTHITPLTPRADPPSSAEAAAQLYSREL